MVWLILAPTTNHLDLDINQDTSARKKPGSQARPSLYSSTTSSSHSEFLILIACNSREQYKDDNNLIRWQVREAQMRAGCWLICHEPQEKNHIKIDQHKKIGIPMIWDMDQHAAFYRRPSS